MQKLLVRGEEKLPDSLLNVIRRKQEKKGLDSMVDYDVKWRLLHGKFASSETRVLLSEAVAIFHVSVLLLPYLHDHLFNSFLFPCSTVLGNHTSLSLVTWNFSSLGFLVTSVYVLGNVSGM